jgi:hypothetical protein
MSPEELAARAREYYVGRDKMIAARLRLFRHGKESDDTARKMAFVNKMLDSYVHGAYMTAMEVFNGKNFMIAGTKSLEQKKAAKNMVSAKLFEALVALELMARTRKLPDLVREIASDRQKLEDSGESS